MINKKDLNILLSALESNIFNKEVIDIINDNYNNALVEHQVFNMNELNDKLKNEKPMTILRLTDNEFFSLDDDYFYCDTHLIGSYTKADYDSLLNDYDYEIRICIVEILKQELNIEGN